MWDGPQTIILNKHKHTHTHGANRYEQVYHVGKSYTKPKLFISMEIYPCSNYKNREEGFPGGAVVENLPASAGDTGSSPGLGRSHMPWSN